jgi:hypothetical protein
MYYQMSTKNESFLEMSKLLKSRGVKNNKFMLRLDNRRLVDIDPYDKDLSSDIEMLILQECRSNIWYFLREVIRVREPMSDEKSRFRLNLSTTAFIWLHSMQVSSIIHTPRQQCATLTIHTLEYYTRYISPYFASSDYKAINDFRIYCPVSILGLSASMKNKVNYEINYINDFEEMIYKEIKNNHKTPEYIEQLLYDSMLNINHIPTFINTVMLDTIPGTKMNPIYGMIDYCNLLFCDYMYDMNTSIFDKLGIPVLVKYSAEDLMTDEQIESLKKSLENDEETIEREIYMRRYIKKEEPKENA